VRPLWVRLGPVRVVGPGGCIAHRIVVSRRCASPGPPSQEANKRRRVLWHGRCSLHWRDGFHPRTRFGRARCMGRFVHRHGPTRHTRGPIAGLSHNHADPASGTNDRGETTFGRPTTVRPLDTISKCGEGQSHVPFSILRGFWCSHLPPRQHLYKYKCKGDLLQVVNAPGGSGKTLALATLPAEQEEIRSRSATWQLVEGLGSCDPPR